MKRGKSKKAILLEKLMRRAAMMVLMKYHPKIVAITGSVGKTTTKETVAALLGGQFRVRQNEKNYNNEIGVPLTIIGAVSGESSWWGWLTVFVRWLRLFAVRQEYPEILILEMGADRPGDIKYLCSFIPIDVAVVTNVGMSHLEFFKSKQALAREKGTLLRSVKAGGAAIYNLDDEELKKIGNGLGVEAKSFGFSPGADFQASDVLLQYPKEESGESSLANLPEGLSFKLNHQGKIIPIKLNGAVSRSQVYSALIALAVGEHFKINAVEISQAIAGFIPPPGRMNILAGIKKTVIIDDTYNSAPDSVEMALETLKLAESSRKIAVLGDMLELGKEEETAHLAVAEKAKEIADVLVLVGKRMERAYQKISSGQDKGGCQLAHYLAPMEAGKFIQAILHPGDVVLVKGSQGMRLEKVTEEIMAQPEKKEQLLVRQDEHWRQKAFIQP